MRLDDLYLWYLGDPATPRYVGALKLIAAGKGVSLRYGKEWLGSGFALSEDLPLIDVEYLPPGRLTADAQRAVAAVLASVIEVVDTWQAHFAQSGVTERDIESLAERIDSEELLTQRTGFDPAGFGSVPAKRTNISPFRRS